MATSPLRIDPISTLSSAVGFEDATLRAASEVYQWGVTDPTSRLAVRRMETLELIEALGRRLNGIIESSAYTSNDDEHDPEGVTVAFERAQVAGLLEQARAELRAVDAAGERLAAGTYGTCGRCGDPIAAERLDALPAVTTCIRCANHR